MIIKYQTYNKSLRSFHLYDTFTGMTPPKDVDVDYTGNTAESQVVSNIFVKAECPYIDVLNNIQRYSDYDINKIIFHIGDIVKNEVYPEKIAILRLDTDWYESTKFELDNFYKYVVKGGIVIIDDYGHWKGCKQAVDEFIEKNPEITLIQIDETGVYFIKP